MFTMYKTIKWTLWLPLITIVTVFTFPVIVIFALISNDSWTDFRCDIADFYGDMWKVGEKRG